jgi:hypothetical protein
MLTLRSISKWISPFLLLILATCAGCSANTFPLQPSGIPTITSIVPTSGVTLDTITPENIEQIQPTERIEVTETPKGSTPTQLPTPTTTHTPSLVKTMTSEEKEKEALQLLKTNGGCTYPCFWGFMPGVTRYSEMRYSMMEKGFRFLGPYRDKYYDTGMDFQTAYIVLRIETEVVDDTVQAISVGLGGTDLPDLAPNFLLPALMNTLEEPTEVWFDSSFMEGVAGRTTANYTFWIYFEPKGTILHFSGVGRLHSDHIEICPGDRNRFVKDPSYIDHAVSFYFQSVDSERPLSELHAAIGDVIPESARKIEDVSEINTTTFYNIITGASDEACFNTPRKYWAIQ